MSQIPLSITQEMRFYLSGLGICPYLPGKIERKLFTRLDDDTDKNLRINSILTRAGFRRSHDIVYRPACPDCTACTPVRIPVASFHPSRSQKRVLKQNIDLQFGKNAQNAGTEEYTLFIKYQRDRHSDGEMAQMTEADFAAMVRQGGADTSLYRLTDHMGKLWGAMLCDRVDDGLSAVYSFYSTDVPQRGLGTLLILRLIEEALRQNLHYIYLGYWIANSEKMSYKARFSPLEKLSPHGWITDE